MYIMMVEWLDVSLNSIGKFRASEIFKTKESESMAGEKKYNYIYIIKVWRFQLNQSSISKEGHFFPKEGWFLGDRGLPTLTSLRLCAL